MSTRVPKSKLFPFAVDEEVALRKLFQNSVFGIGDLLDVDVSLPEDGDVLVFNDSLGIWENQPQSGGATELSDLTDVDTAGATDGQVLTYDDGTGTWVPTTVSGTGTVTSVGLALPAQFTISNSPVTTTGTLTAAWADVTSRHALLGQTSGDGPPAFRAFTPADITYTGNSRLAGYSDGSVGIEVTLGTGLSLTSGGELQLSTNLQGWSDIATSAKQDTLVSGTNIKSVGGTSLLGSGNVPFPIEIGVACSDETTNLTTGTAKITFRMPAAMTLTAVRASLSTAQPSGSIFTVDINEGGTSILSTKLTIDNTEKTSTTAATAAVISDSSLADDAEITIDIDQVGDAGAKGLKVWLIGTKT